MCVYFVIHQFQMYFSVTYILLLFSYFPLDAGNRILLLNIVILFPFLFLFLFHSINLTYVYVSLWNSKCSSRYIFLLRQVTLVFVKSQYSTFWLPSRVLVYNIINIIYFAFAILQTVCFFKSLTSLYLPFILTYPTELFYTGWRYLLCDYFVYCRRIFFRLFFNMNLFVVNSDFDILRCLYLCPWIFLLNKYWTLIQQDYFVVILFLSVSNIGVWKVIFWSNPRFFEDNLSFVSNCF